MPRALLLFVLGLASGPAAADAGDPLATPSCRQALQQLERHEAAASAARRGNDQPIEPTARAAIAAAQRDASTACLRGAPDPITPHSLPAPISVTPIEAPRRVEPLRGPAVPAPAVQPVRPVQPTTITTCDALGCWTHDGTRLQRAGPNLLGPRGLCSGTGPVVACP